MYRCPLCNKAFPDEDTIVKHSMKCWREQYPNHKSKPAPCKGNTTVREIDPQIEEFFAAFGRG